MPQSDLMALVATGDADGMRSASLEGADVAQLAGIAVILGHIEVLRALAERAPGPLSQPDGDGKTVAFMAASTGNVEALRVLAHAAPVSLGLPIVGGVTPIDAAWHRGHDACVDLLRSVGIPDPMERWQSCCDGEACEPKPVREVDSMLS